MAKRGAPSKTCIKCGKSIHARSKTCPHCSAKQPSKAAAAAKPGAKRSRRPTARKQSTEVGPLTPEHAKDLSAVVDTFGGIEETKRALDELSAWREALG